LSSVAHYYRFCDRKKVFEELKDILLKLEDTNTKREFWWARVLHWQRA